MKLILNKHIIVFCIAISAVILSGIAYAEIPGWTVTPSEYQYNASITCVAFVDNIQATDTSSMLAAFYKDTVRGVAKPIVVGANTVFFLTVYGNKISGDTLTFRYYDRALDTTLSCDEKIHFTSDAQIGDPLTPFAFHASTVPGTQLMSFKFSAGWNMMSLPIAVTDRRRTILYPTALSDAFSFFNGYQQNTSLHSGLGYWMKFSTDSTLRTATIAGAPKLADTVTVQAGWNMIGSVAAPVSAAGLVALGTTVESSCFTFNSGYQISDSIKPGKGYWIKVSSSGRLVFNSAFSTKSVTVQQKPRGQQ